ncbi:MAG: SpoIIE family protein phosphatase [Bacteroidetes bacterium]|nr:SpoIIE family protein phosphatase [Bacteroidota bacterium]
MKILLVEDELNIAKLFEFNLKKAGFIVEIANNGKAGYELAKEVNPDLILSDIMMPEIDGFEFRKLILQDPELKKIPFVFLTAKGEEEDILEGYDLDIQDYIIKTASTKVVIAKVSAILNSHKKERAKVVAEVQQAADNMRATVVPKTFPVFDGYEIRHWHVPFENVPGGDFIDYFKFDDDNLVIILGDVMGKKWGAWYFAVAYAGYVRSAIRFALQTVQDLSPAKIITKVNESVCKDERIAEVFITLSVVIINKTTNKIKYSGAGDLPLVYRKDKIDYILSKGLLLGFDESSEYNDHELDLNPGDELFLLTDGIMESRNKLEEQFGHEGFLNSIKETPAGGDSMEMIKKTFTDFTNGKFEDDVSLIEIKKL